MVFCVGLGGLGVGWLDCWGFGLWVYVCVEDSWRVVVEGVGLGKSFTRTAARGDVRGGIVIAGASAGLPCAALCRVAAGLQTLPPLHLFAPAESIAGPSCLDSSSSSEREGFTHGAAHDARRARL